MAIDPATGLWVDQIYHSPGPGGSTNMGGAMDVLNALQGRNLYSQHVAQQAVDNYLNMSKNAPAMEGFLATPEGQEYANTLHLPQNIQESVVQSSPWYRERQALGGLTEESTPLEQLKAFQAGGDTSVKTMLPYLRAQYVEAQKTKRAEGTQESKDYRDLLDRSTQMFNKLTSNGMPPAQAAAVIDVQLLRYAPPTVTEEQKETIRQAAQNGQLADFNTPLLTPGAQAEEREARAGKEKAQAAQITVLTDPKKQALIASVIGSGALATLRGLQADEERRKLSGNAVLDPNKFMPNLVKAATLYTNIDAVLAKNKNIPPDQKAALAELQKELKTMIDAGLSTFSEEKSGTPASGTPKPAAAAPVPAPAPAAVPAAKPAAATGEARALDSYGQADIAQTYNGGRYIQMKDGRVFDSQTGQDVTDQVNAKGK